MTMIVIYGVVLLVFYFARLSIIFFWVKDLHMN